MTTTEFDSLRDQVEIDIHTIGMPEDLSRMLGEANRTRSSRSGRVWFLFAGPADDDACLAAGVRGAVGALEWIADQRWVPAGGLNPAWVDYYTVDLDDNAMPPQAELPLADVIAAAAEFVRTGRRPVAIEWRLAVG